MPLGGMKRGGGENPLPTAYTFEPRPVKYLILGGNFSGKVWVFFAYI